MPSLEDLTPEARDELALLARELSENPATREHFLRLTKQARPNLTIDTIDIKDQVSQVVQQAEDRVNALENKLREKEALEDLRSRRDALVRKGKAKSDEDIAEIEKLMLEKGITSHETAADYFTYMKQAAKPTPVKQFNPNVMDETARGTLQKFWKNPAAAARDEASNALMELRKNPRPIGI
jgi:DNA-binding protein H-NS